MSLMRNDYISEELKRLSEIWNKNITVYFSHEEVWDNLFINNDLLFCLGGQVNHQAQKNFLCQKKNFFLFNDSYN